MKLVEELSRGKEGMESGYLVLDLAPAPWEDSVLDLALAPWKARWCHLSQPPVNSTALSGSLSWGLFPGHTPLTPHFPWQGDRICIP